MRDAYGWDHQGNFRKHFDSLVDGSRENIIVVEELFPIWFPSCDIRGYLDTIVDGFIIPTDDYSTRTIYSFLDEVRLPKTKYDHRPNHKQVISDEGLTLDEAVARFTNQPEKVI